MNPVIEQVNKTSSVMFFFQFRKKYANFVSISAFTKIKICVAKNKFALPDFGQKIVRKCFYSCLWLLQLSVG